MLRRQLVRLSSCLSQHSTLCRGGIPFGRAASLHMNRRRLHLQSSPASSTTNKHHTFDASSSSDQHQSGDVTSQSSDVTPLARQLSARMRATGPMTVAQYMAEVLTHPLQGYYTRSPGIGGKGDFVTAPELGSMYGEMLGVWLVHEWQKLGAPRPLQLVELGPGRGTLTADILQVIERFVPDVDLSVHLVEVSRQLALTQAETLDVRLTSQPDGQSQTGTAPGDQSQTGTTPSDQSQTSNAAEDQSQSGSRTQSQSETSVSADSQSEARAPTEIVSSDSVGTVDLLRGVTSKGRHVYWHARLQDVPEAFSLYVANEFFDAMPVHQFRRTEGGWREVLVDVSPEDRYKFRFVLARGATPACKFIDESSVGDRDELEICPRAAVLCSLLADRIASDGGAALVCDYGHCGDRGDTLRAFRNHKCVDPLLSPGGADITCDVDFAALAAAAGPDVICFGPVTQREFLHRMGLGVRLQRILVTSTLEQSRQLRAVYEMLTGEMGERFKMWAMLPATCEDLLKRYPPAGFTPEGEETVAEAGSENSPGR